MTAVVLVDTGPLVAFLSATDIHHPWVCEHLKSLGPPLLTCEAVLAETVFLLQRRPGATEKLFELANRGVVRLDFSLAQELDAVSALMKRYANRPMSLADACLVRMSELRPNSRLFTMDQDFKIYRRRGRQTIPLIIPD